MNNQPVPLPDCPSEFRVHEHVPMAHVAKMPVHELWIGFLRDPDGNLVGLMEEKRADR